MNSRTDLSPNRVILILRLWRNAPHSQWIVEIQNVKTGEITHLSGLDAIAGYIENEARSGLPGPAGSQPDLPSNEDVP